MYFAYFPFYSMAMKNIQVRVDEKQANKAKKIFQRVGLDIPTAFRMFLIKSIDVGGIPFLVTHDDFEDNYSPEQIAEIDRAAEEALAGKNMSKPFSTVKELLKDLHSASE